MKRNPDDRDDNVERIQKSIDGTVRNMRETNKEIRATTNKRLKGNRVVPRRVG